MDARNTNPQNRGQRLLAAFAACALLALGFAAAPAQALDKEAVLSVSATVVAKCQVTTSPFDAAQGPGSSLAVACSQNAGAAQIEHSTVRSYTSTTFSGDVMVATVNF